MFMTDVTLNSRRWNSLGWTPGRSVHPGVFLQEHIEARGISPGELAQMAGMSLKLVNGIIAGSRSISARTAVRLQQALGVETCVWHLLQVKWNLLQAQTGARMAMQAGMGFARRP
jgi:addiction module HigA family antidote